MTKEEKIKSFDPNSIGQLNEGMYGLPFTIEECEVILVPVPWEVTVSYGGGTAEGPQAILNASYQVDLYDPCVKDAWKKGIAMDEIDAEVRSKSDNMRRIAERHIEALAGGGDAQDEELRRNINTVREESLWLNNWVKERVLHFIAHKKYVAL